MDIDEYDPAAFEAAHAAAAAGLVDEEDPEDTEINTICDGANSDNAAEKLDQLKELVGERNSERTGKFAEDDEGNVYELLRGSETPIEQDAAVCSDFSQTPAAQEFRDSFAAVICVPQLESLRYPPCAVSQAMQAVDQVCVFDAQRHLVRVGARGDGTCFIHAILRAQNLATTDPMALRWDIVAGLDPENFDVQGEPPRMSPLKTLAVAQELALLDNYLGEGELGRFFSNLLRVTIIVLSKIDPLASVGLQYETLFDRTAGAPFFVSSTYTYRGDGDLKNAIVLYHIGGNHWEVIGLWNPDNFPFIQFNFHENDDFVQLLYAECEANENTFLQAFDQGNRLAQDDDDFPDYNPADYGDEPLAILD